MPDRILETRESGRSRSARARAAKLTPEERHSQARDAALARWQGRRALVTTSDGAEVEADDAAPELEDVPPGDLPKAAHWGVLNLLGLEVPCYVLSNGQRVIGRTAATQALTGIRGGGAFEKYISVAVLRPFISVDDVSDRMVGFRLPEVEGLERSVKGLPTDLMIDVCQGFIRALEASTRPDATFRLTPRQLDMALKASMFLSSCAKVGLDALVDEATGYQYERAQDALQVKLRAYLETEMRKWEKTFPDELWMEFGRLTGWSRSVTKRPNYWGILVNELVYHYLDDDVFQWLKENAPAPRKGQNYHQWLTSQYGLKKLVEHIWKLIGIAQTCQNMTELKDRMAELNGHQPFQLRLYLPPQGEDSTKTVL